MDESDQDFVDLCSKLLKRVRRKAGDTGLARKAESQSSAKTSDLSKKRRHRKGLDPDSKRATAASTTQSASTGTGADPSAFCINEFHPEEPVANGGLGHDSGSTEPPLSADPCVPEASDVVERVLRPKDKVLFRMQQFKRVSPLKLTHNEKSEPTGTVSDCVPLLPQIQDRPEPSTSGLHLEPQNSDEALALRLQQELDRDAAGAQTVNLEDGGLFFCQLCHRDLSHMTPEGRTQHLNRCLDESEDSAPAPPPPPGVPDCPICGKRFKSQKSRSAHLKRCSSDMGVAPAVLLQCLQRQAAEAQSDSAANQPVQAGGSKRKGPSEPGLPARKKPRRKAKPLDEDTMVALALSSSLLEQERGREREREVERELQRRTAAPHTSVTPQLTWRTGAGKGRGKRKKGGAPCPPPLLLTQDGETALRRLQERVSALLLRGRPPSPPTPPRRPSGLPTWSGASPLWQKSALRDGGPSCPAEFYTPELRAFLVPGEPAGTDVDSTTEDKPDPSSHPPVGEGAALSAARSSVVPSSSQTAPSSVPSTPGTGHLPVGSQALEDLAELAEEGMALSQWGRAAPGPAKESSSAPDLRLSGFVPEEPEGPADLRLSGFVPDTTRARAAHGHGQARRGTGEPGADAERSNRRSVAVSRLASDLSSMVNNPQLSDVQLQVDSGEVYFAHSFMLYARCPLLAQMVHDGGFGVQEEGMPAAQRVLLEEVEGEAVYSLLQYLYTAHCHVSPSLLPHVLELASRFDLEGLQQLCQLHQGETETQGEEKSWQDCLGQEQRSGSEEARERGQTFMALLQSMWKEEDEDGDGRGVAGGRDGEEGSEEGGQADELTSGDGEMREEHVNEEEMMEIYEFAATQRKQEEKDGIEEEKDGIEEEEKGSMEKEEDEGDTGDLMMEKDQVFTKPNGTEPKAISTDSQTEISPPGSHRRPDLSLDRSYSRLFADSWGVYEEEPSSPPSSSSPHPPKTQPHCSQQQGSPRKPSRTDEGGRPTDCLQSSAREVIDLSISPPPSTSSLPVPGLSPGSRVDKGGGNGDEGTGEGRVELDMAEEERLSPKRESQGPRSISVPLSPASPQRTKEPELIVLSDSSEEMGVDLAAVGSPSPSPPSPYPSRNLQNYTRIKLRPDPDPEPNKPVSENKRSGILESSLSAPSPAPGAGQSSLVGVDQGPVDCSPEVSWLIPATPVQTSRSSSSTQTYSSMCRTQLFPKDDRIGSRSSSSNINRSTESNSIGKSKGREVDSGVPSPHSSVKSTPLRCHPQPYSSTPLLTDPPKLPVPPGASPLHSDPDREGSMDQGSEFSKSPVRRGMGSLHLSPSDPSNSPSSSLHRGPPSPRGDSGPSSQRRSSVMSRYHDHTERRLTERVGGQARRMGNEEGERVEGEDGGSGAEGEQEIAAAAPVEVCESSSWQSLMAVDEPPMAFNDSWGLNAGDQGVCFSLRLEDSGGTGSHEPSLAGGDPAGSSSPPRQPQTPTSTVHPFRAHNPSPPTRTHTTRPSSSLSPTPATHAPTGPPLTPSPGPNTHAAPEVNASLMDSKIWDSWDEEEEEEKALPLSQRVNPVAQLKTPVSSHNKKGGAVVPITPMPGYSDMDTPELKNKLNRFGVRPLPKRQMILKLKEIHQYTHQLVSSDSEDEAPSLGRPAQAKPQPAAATTTTVAPSTRPVSCAQPVKFKQPKAPTGVSPVKHNSEEDAELLSASQGSSTSSTAASEDSERSNPELCLSSDGDSDSDGSVTASQAASRQQDRIKAVRAFILSDPELYNQILQYQPLVLSQLQARLKAAGIRLGAAKLLDYLDSQCITFTTAKPGRSAPNRRRGKGRGTGKGPKAAGERGARGRKRGTATALD
ncbi:structure-specific endonuclease subunit SLX4 [Polymixia lowei]